MEACCGFPILLTPLESNSVFDALYHDLTWREDKILMFGKRVTIPRLQAWYGDASYQYSNLKLDPLPWIDCTTRLTPSLRNGGLSVHLTPSSRIYIGQVKIRMDGTAIMNPELGEQPVIASLSFGATRRFSLKHNATKQKVIIDLPAGSLLVMAGELQRHWKHCVPKTARYVDPRINLTFRQIYK